MTPQGRKRQIERALRSALESADHLFLAEAARAVGSTDDPNAALVVQYPMLDDLQREFRASVGAAWHDANQRALSMLRARGRRLLIGVPMRHAASPEAEALSLIIEAEDLVIPQAAVDRYAIGRVVPLRTTISEARKTLCRDLIARMVGEGRSIKQIMRGLEQDGFGTSAHNRETIARTESTTLYSQGAVARYHASACVTGLRFSAILDGRETQVCHDLNGREFRTDDASGITPPLHFMCRSDLDPILFDERPQYSTAAEYLGDDETTNPMDGFGQIDLTGFPAARDARELYRPLVDSDRAELRGLYDTIMRSAEERWGSGWWR